MRRSSPRKRSLPSSSSGARKAPRNTKRNSWKLRKKKAHARKAERRRAGEDEHDEIFEDAVRLVLEFGKASTSLLQRRLRIGYGRAAHLIDLMERDGIVGPADGPKPREILKRPDWLSEVEEAMR